MHREGVVALIMGVALGLLFVSLAECRFHDHDEIHKPEPTCVSGKYYNHELKQCSRCSRCPKNEIIRRPCERLDTICGPFMEFDRFHQAPAADETSNKAADSAHDTTEKKGNTNNNIVKNNINNKSINKENVEYETADENNAVVRLGNGESERNEVGRYEPGLATVTNGADGQWKSLALVLIGVLSVVSLLLVFFVVMACYMLKRRRLTEKKLICSSDVNPSGQYFRPPVFTGERLTPTDQRRALLPVDSVARNSSQRKMNMYQVYNAAPSCLGDLPTYCDQVEVVLDDVNVESSSSTPADSTESMASASTVPSSSACGADSSGYSSGPTLTEVVAGPSTDYVYFKAPVKHGYGQV